MDIATEGATERKTCIVVDENDNELYIGGLAECHVRPMTLHRAFSLFVFDDAGRLLLQQRAKTKYTFPLAWTNTVCSHPRTAEKSMEEWIDLRVQDELGWSIKDVGSRLRPVGKLTYSAISDAKYGEKEVDTLYFIQISEDEKAGMNINRDEVEAIDWVEPERLTTMLQDDRYLITPWFRAIANGFGHPFFETIQNFDVDAALTSEGSPDKQSLIHHEELPQEVTSNSTTGEVSISKVIEPVSGKAMPWFRVGNCSMARAGPDSEMLLQAPFSYLCSNPGKNLRSELIKLYAQLDAGVSEADVKAITSVVDRVHTASMLHDDIEDRSLSRRGAVCAHRIWGVAQTINTGTFNFLRAIQAIDTEFAHRDEATRSQLMRCMVDMEINLHRGQNADICWAEQALCPTIAEYVEMSDRKIGSLFKACASLGSICSGNVEMGQMMEEQLVELGRLYTIRDDFCNICDPSYWKAKGFYEDADDGKYSYPILVYLEKKSDRTVSTDSENDEKVEECDGPDWLRARLANKDIRMTQEEKLKAYGLLYDSGALHETREVCLTKLEALRNSVILKSPLGVAILNIVHIPAVQSPSAVQAFLTSTPQN